MIQELCNIGNEHSIDTFYKIAIIEASQLQKFNHLTPYATIESIITNIADSYQVLITDLLPKNIQVANPSKINDSGVTYDVKISFVLTPQDKNLQALLETYINKEVIALVSKRNTSHLFGTTAQPLLFKYSAIHTNDPSTLKGYAVTLEGETNGPEKMFENIAFNIYTRGLAFQLAAEM